MAASLTTLALAAVILAASLSQGDAQSCFTASILCTGASITLVNNPDGHRDCCIGTGQSFTTDGNDCEICYVVGYRESTRVVELNEGAEASLIVEIIKPPHGPDTQFFSVNALILNAANSDDIRVGGDDNPTVPLVFGPFSRSRTFTLRAEADQIGQEGQETFSIPLGLDPDDTPPRTVFLAPAAQVSVNDLSGVVVALTEADYQEREGRSPAITARVSYNRELANDITVTLNPVTYTEYARREFTLPPGFPARDDGAEFEARESDFTGTPIVITLPRPGGGVNRQVDISIPITDDQIVEHPETFVGYIEITDSIDRGTITIDRNASQLIINDNDDITIGFTESSYTFTEGQSVMITLEKDSNRVSERNDIAARITLDNIRTATEGVDFSIVVDTVIPFSSSEQSVNIPLSILEDTIPEGVESFTLVVESAGFAFGANRVNTFERTQVVINDNDNVEVGLEQTEYTVSEEAGTVEICAVVTNPPSNQPLSSPFTLSTDTIQRSAIAGTDFTAVSITLPEFNDANRRHCFNIPILQDDAVEDDENFNALISLVTGNGVTVDPSSASVTITDTDTLTIGLVETMYTVNEGDISVTVCAAVTSGSVGRETIVSLTATEDSATDPEDFTAASTPLIFEPGDPQMCSPFLIQDDGLLEDTEMFNVRLATVEDRVTLDPIQGIVSIIDNDNVRVGFEELMYTVNENGGRVEVCAEIDQGQIATDVIVNIETADGTAMANNDYTPIIAGTLTFTSPSTRACTNIDIEDDQLFEADENFFGRLSSPDPTRVTINPSRDETDIQITDQDSLTIGFTPESVAVTVIEGDVARLCARVLSGSIGRDVPITFSTEDGTADAPSDYTATSRVLTFSDSTEICVDVPTTEDNIFEPDQNFVGRLTDNVPRVTVSPATSTVTIQDDDDIRAVIGFRQSAYTVVEGEGSVTVEVDLLSGTIPAGNDVIVSFSTADQTARAPGDYSQTQSELTFNSANTRIPVTIPIVDDSDIEDVERFLASLNIDSIAYPEVTVRPNQASVDIISNDLRVGFLQPTATVAEDDSGISLTVAVLEGTLAPQLGDIPVTVATGDVTATNGADYAGFTQTFTFNSGTTTQTFSVPIIDDSIIEPPEDFTATATSTTNGVTVDPNRATVTIQDNDVVIGFSQTDYTVNEDDGTVQLFVSVREGAIPAGETRTVTLSTTDGTARAPGDYTSIPSRTLTFSNGQPTSAVPITIIDDTDVETNLERFTANLRVNPATNPGVTVDPATATVVIDDNDVEIGFVERSTTVSETADDAVVFVAIIDGDIPAGERYVVTVTTQDVTAQSGTDYTRTTTLLTFTSSTRTSQPANIPIIDDNVVEDRERFEATLSVSSQIPVTLGLDETEVVILDDDVVIGLERTDYTTNEGMSVNLVARVLEGEITQNTVVTLTTSDGTATSPEDYTSLNSAPLTFTPGVISRSVLLNTVQDNNAENQEQLTVSLAVDSGRFPGVTLRDDTATVDIIDDDTVMVVLSSDEYRVLEDAGSREVCVEIQPPDTLQRTVVVTLATSPSSATSPSDYTNLQRTVTFQPGVNERCVNVQIRDDDITEPEEEELEVTITTNDPQTDLGSPNRATIIIEDDDPAVIGFVQTEYTVMENIGSVSIAVNILDGELSDDVTVMFTTSDGTATRAFPSDYTPVTRTLTFGPTRTRELVAVPISNDRLFENIESFFANLVLRTTNDLDVSVNPIRSEITIINEDEVEIGLESTSYTVDEDGGTIQVCARVNQGLSSLERDVVVSLNMADNTAISSGPNADYTSSVQMFTFNSANNVRCFSIPIEDDDILEDDEVFDIFLTTDETGVNLTPERGIVNILNEDDVTIGFESPVYSVNEERGTIEICVEVKDGGFQSPLRVTLNSRDGSASSAFGSRDYTPVLNRALTFQPGSTSECIDLPVTDDTVDEQNIEDLFLTLTTNEDQVSLTPDTTRVAIIDDDQVVIGFEQTAVTTSEDQPSVELCASIQENSLDRSVDITLSTQPGTATAGVDYSSVNNLILRFDATNTRRCTTIAITDDNVVEPNSETFTATLTDSPSDGVILRPDEATVTIIDDTPLTFGFERTMYTQVEGRQREVCVIVLDPVSLARQVTVRISSQDINATAGSDYTALSNVPVVFEAGDGKQCFNVTLLSDDILEGREQLRLNLISTEPRMTFTPPSTIINILNEGGVVIGLEMESYTVSEGVPLQEVCAVIVEGTLDSNVEVNLTTNPRSAIGGGVDYTTVSRVLQFNSQNTRACVNIPINDDNLDENDEMLDVILTTTNTVVELVPDQGMVTITDNDVTTIALNPTQVTVAEDGGPVEFCAQVVGSVNLQRSVQITFSTTPNTATALQDYSPVTDTFMFDSTTTRDCVEIPILEDEILENSETFSVTISSTDGVTVSPSQGTVTITDTSSITPEFEQTEYTVPEDEGPIEVCVVVPSGQIERETILQLASMAGSATSGDYDVGPYTVTFTVGSTRQCVDIDITDDDTPEPDETFTVTIPPTPDVTPPDTPTIVTIEDDDVVIGFDMTVYRVGGDDGTVELRVSVLDGTLSGPTIVIFTTEDGTATAPEDYTAVTRLLTFTPGLTTSTIPISITRSVLNEPEENFFGNLTLISSPDSVVILPDEAEVEITPIGAARIGFDQTLYEVNEDIGTVTVLVRLFEGNLSEDVTVTLNTRDGSATSSAPSDYTLISRSLTFGPSVTSIPVTIPIIDDDVVESVENFFASLNLTTPGANVVISPDETEIRISDDDSITPEFEQTEYTVPEDEGPIEVCVVVPSGQIERETILQLASTAGSATSGDFEVGPYTVTFTVGSTRQCVDIDITDDDTPEPDETFTVTIPPTPDVTPPDTPTLVTIEDDDVVIGFERTLYSVEGDDGRVDLVVSLIEGTASGNIVITIETQDSTATSPADYISVSTELTFSPTVTTVVVPVTIEPSVLNEPVETFSAGLTILSPGEDSVTLQPPVAEVLITPVGAARIGFEQTLYEVDEDDGSVSTTVSVLGGSLSGNVVVSFTTTDGTATSSAPSDYTLTSRSLTFGPSVTSIPVTIPIIDDDVVESVENFFASLTLTTPGANVVISPDETEIRISDDDTITPEFEQTEYTVPEDEGPIEVCVVVPSGQIERETILQLASTAGSASSGDYDVGPYTVTFTVGSTRQCVDIDITDDDTPEPDETFTVTIPPTPDVTPPDTPTIVTIEDDDVVVGFDRTSYVVRGNAGSVNLSISVIEGTPSGNVVVRLNTRDGTATSPSDYASADELLTFSPTTSTIVVQIPITPTVLNEGIENFFADLTLVSSGDDSVTVQPPVSQVTITPDGAARIGFERPLYIADEDSGSVTVVASVLEESLSGNVVVSFTTTDGTATSSAPSDYTLTSRSLTFGPSVTSIPVTIPIIDDDVVESVENFFASLTLTTPGANVVINPDETEIRIRDDDIFTPRFERTEYTIPEDQGPETVCILVPEGQLERQVVVTFFTTNGLARESEDYMPQNFQLTFEPGDTRVCRVIPIVDDTNPEPNESFTVTITVPGSSPISTTVTIIDDDEECEQLSDIPFGSVTQTGRQVGDTATYTCNIGFELIGNPTRSCVQVNTDVAEFDGQEPVCRPLCAEQAPITFGSVVSTGTSVGDTATYSCDSGFTLVGVSTTTCTQINPSSAVYTPNPPTCQPLCRLLTSIPFGTVSQSGREPGDTATYSCNSGFELVGDPTRTCTVVGPGTAMFSGDEPSCRPLCDDLVAPTSGSVTLSGNSVGDTATYTCNPGFNIVGPSVRVCEMTRFDEADWSLEPPVCEPDCPQLSDIQFGTVIQTGQRPGDTATYTCDSGFELVGDMVRTCRQIDSTTTSFDGEQPTCRPICDDLQNPAFGTVVLSGNSVGDTATYSCNPGYTAVGTTTRICEQVSTGRAEWSSQPPICQRITVRFARPSYTFTESGVQGSIEVIRTGVSSSPFTVRVSGGPSNQPNIERSAPVINELITFGAGPNATDRITVTFPLTDDSVALEDVERFFVDLTVETPNSGVLVVEPERTQINVLDDDAVRVDFGRPEASFNESDGIYTMCIVKNTTTAQRVTVELSNTPGTALLDEDYRSVILRLISIDPTSDRTCFNGIIIDDLIGGEGIEFFTLDILEPQQPGVVIGLDETTINIDDDDVVTVMMVRPTESIPETSGEARVCARKDIATAGPVEAIITTSPGKAGDGVDYTGGSYTVTFGQEANDVACANIDIVVDNIFEDIEDFNTNLLPGATGDVEVGPQDNTVVFIDDLGSDVVNDTLIGDPLLTVPLPQNSLVAVQGVREASLCYEVHGTDDAWFNILSDGCVSVNAHYFRFNEYFNFVDKIAIRAVDENGNCRNMLVELNGCTASLDGTVVEPTAPYCQDGIFVRPNRQTNRVRISVPNCNETSSLVMWTICQRNTLMDPFDMTKSYQVDMIKFVIARGSNLGASSHGIIGQFWNIPISIGLYTGAAADSAAGQRYMIQVNHPDSDPRIFTGLLVECSWERDRTYCFYVGNRQAGTIAEVQDPNDPVIEGSYVNYIMADDFATDFKFSHFDESRCS